MVRKSNGYICAIGSLCKASFVKEWKTIDIGEQLDGIEVYKCSVCGRELSDVEVEEITADEIAFAEYMIGEMGEPRYD